jgi:type IV secretion system protein VirB4
MPYIDPDLLDIMGMGGTALRAAAMIAGVGAAAAAAALVIPSVLDQMIPPPSQDRLADYLLFDTMASPSLIRMTDGRYCSVLEFAGAELTLSKEDDHESLFLRRKHVLDDLQKHPAVEQVNVFQIKERNTIRQASSHRSPFLKAVAEKWNTNFEHSYRLRHVMLVFVKAGNDEDAAERMDAATRFILDMLKDYKSQLLKEDPERPETGPLAAIASVVSPVTRPTPLGMGWQDSVSYLLTADKVSFREERKGLISFENGVKKKYATIVNIRDCGEKTMESVVKDILGLEAELTVYHGIQPLNSARQTIKLAREAKAAPMMRFSFSAAEEYREVSVMVEGSISGKKAALLQYAMHVIVYGDSEKECMLIESQVISILARTGGTPVRERAGAQAVWFSMFQHDRIWPRMYRMLSDNIAANLYMQRVNTGMEKSDWIGEPLSYFRSIYGAAYGMQLHATTERQAPGHCVMIGPTGKGKTTFISFLAGQAMRIPELRVFFFDRHHGLKVFTECVGGKYVTFDGEDSNTGMNPLHLAETNANKQFLVRFIKRLADVSSPSAEAEIMRAISLIYRGDLPKADRSLAAIHSLAFSAHGEVRAKIDRWTRGAYASFFNADEDSLDLRTNRMVSFDMTNILKEDSQIATPVMDYIIHRLKMLSQETGDPALIFIDETEPMLQNPEFAKDFVRTGLQEGRKARQAYILAFQRAEAIRATGMSEMIRGQCKTAFFFRNPAALAEDFTEWGLNTAEIAFIQNKDFQNYPYAVLVKKYETGESAIIDLDMKSLGRYFNGYQSGNTDRRLLAKAQAEFGDNWVDRYLDLPR